MGVTSADLVFDDAVLRPAERGKEMSVLLKTRNGGAPALTKRLTLTLRAQEARR